jgi:hypothetical protein
VNSDSQGLDPSHLRKVLSRWNPSDASKFKLEPVGLPPLGIQYNSFGIPLPGREASEGFHRDNTFLK